MTESLYFVHVFNQEVVEKGRYVLHRKMALKTVARVVIFTLTAWLIPGLNNVCIHQVSYFSFLQRASCLSRVMMDSETDR